MHEKSIGGFKLDKKSSPLGARAFWSFMYYFQYIKSERKSKKTKFSFIFACGRHIFWPKWLKINVSTFKGLLNIVLNFQPNQTHFYFYVFASKVCYLPFSFFIMLKIHYWILHIWFRFILLKTNYTLKTRLGLSNVKYTGLQVSIMSFK